MKYSEQYEHQIRTLASNKINSKNYHVFDEDARVIGREKIDGISYLVLINKDGTTILIDGHFEKVLFGLIDRVAKELG